MSARGSADLVYRGPVAGGRVESCRIRRYARKATMLSGTRTIMASVAPDPASGEMPNSLSMKSMNSSLPRSEAVGPLWTPETILLFETVGNRYDESSREVIAPSSRLHSGNPREGHTVALSNEEAIEVDRIRRRGAPPRRRLPSTWRSGAVIGNPPAYTTGCAPPGSDSSRAAARRSVDVGLFGLLDGFGSAHGERP